MFWKEKQTKFSIRKFNLGVASVIIGMTGLLYTIPNEVFSAELPVLAQTNIAREQISYKYVLYSELTSDEKARIQVAIPARQVGNTHTYYMVYRPKVNLPQTGSTLPVVSIFIGLGLLIIGISLTKDRKKRLVRSLIVLTATGSFSVAAISTGSLSGFDKQFTLAVGDVLPQAVISIDQHEFVGFILEGDVNSETVTVTEAVIGEQKSSSELTLPNTLADEAVKRLEKPGSTSIEENLESPITEESPASNQSDSTTESSTSGEPASDTPNDSETPVTPTSEGANPNQPADSTVPSDSSSDSPQQPEKEVVSEQPEILAESEVPASSTPEKESESSQSSSSTESNIPESPTTEESPVSDQSGSTPESSTSGEPASDTPNDSETPVTSASEGANPNQPADSTVPSDSSSDSPQQPEKEVVSEQPEILAESEVPASSTPEKESESSQSSSSTESNVPESPTTEESPASNQSDSTTESSTSGEPASDTPNDSETPITPISEGVNPNQPADSTVPSASSSDSPQQPEKEVVSEQPEIPAESEVPASSTPEKEAESSQSSPSTESNVPESPTTEESPASNQSDSTTESSTSGESASDTPNDSETPVTSASEGANPNQLADSTVPSASSSDSPQQPEKEVVSEQPEIPAESEVPASSTPEKEAESGQSSSSTESNVPESPTTEESPVSDQSGSTPESSTSGEPASDTPNDSETPVTPTSEVVNPNQPADSTVPSASSSDSPQQPEKEVVSEQPEIPAESEVPASSTPEKESESSQSSSSTESNVPESPTTEESPVSDQSDSTPESSTSGEPASDTPNDSETPVTPTSEGANPNQPADSTVPSDSSSDSPQQPEKEVVSEQPEIPAESEVPASSTPEKESESSQSSSSTESNIPEAPTTEESPVSDQSGSTTESSTSDEPASDTPNDSKIPVTPTSEGVNPNQPADSTVPSDSSSDSPQQPEKEVVSEQPEIPAESEVSASSTPEKESESSQSSSSTESNVPESPITEESPVSNQSGSRPDSSTSDEPASSTPEKESELSQSSSSTESNIPEAPTTEESPVSDQSDSTTESSTSDEPASDTPNDSETPVTPTSEGVNPNQPADSTVPSASSSDSPQQPEAPTKIKPELDVAMLKENVDDGTVELSYTLTDNDSAFVKAIVSLHKGDELVTEKEILTKEELAKVRFTDLLLNTEYKVKTRFAYNLGSDDAEEELPTEKFELENKLLELRDYKSIELYQVDENGEKTRVTALSNLPTSTENYLVKIATVNNKDIYLPVDNFENDVNGIKVSIIHPKLVKFNQNNHSFDEHHTFTVDRLVLQEGAYSKFSELVDAINTNPSGTYYLAADMVVDKSVSTDTYITKEFTGSLKSLGDHKTYSILQLDRPLFSTLKNARVENISLKDVAISNEQTEVAALAKKSDKSTIDKVSISGNITAKQNIAGIVYNATNGTTISNSTVNVNLSNTASHESYHMGGVTGILNSSTIDKVRANVTIDAKTASGRGQGIGGIVANAQGAVIKNSYVTGNIHATETADTGGVVGLARMSLLNNIATGASVTNGGIIASGQNAYATVLSTISNLYSVEGHAAGQPNPAIQSTSLSQEAVLEKSKSWGIPTTPTTTGQENTDSQSNSVQTIDYNQVQHAQAERRTAYENTAKLLPFYDRNTIVKYGNLIDETSNLYSKPIRSVLTLTEDGIVTNLYDQHASLNKLLIHFEDGTSEILPLVFKGEYGNTKVVEYRLGDHLLYTPEQLLSLESSLIDELVEAFSQVELYSEKMADILHIQTSDKQAKLKDLYLDESFAEVKANLEDHIKGLLANRQVVDTTSKAVKDVIKKEFLADKEKIMFALAYLNRLYGITYGDTNIKNIVLHHADFYSRQLDNLEWLKSFTDKIIKDTDVYYVSQNGYENMYFDRLTLANNAAIHKERFGHLSGQLGTVRDFLEYNKKLFLGETDSRKWFKEATNAFVYEIPSHANTSIDTSLYSHLGRIPRYEKYYLPLLNIKEKDDIFVLSSMATVAFGGYGRYVDTALKKTNPDQYYQHVQSVQTVLIPKHAKRLGDLLDMWYQMADSHLRDKFIQSSTEIWDGYWIKDSNAFEDQTDKRRWADKYDQEYRYVQELAGALNEWHRKSTDSAFSDTETFVKFSNRDMLSDLGDSTMSHELIHNYDETIMLDGHKRRPGQDAESYAMGLLQSSAGGGIYYYGFNFMNEHSPNTPHNVSSGRFKTKEDLQTYLKGLFDVTYLLDAVEIQAIATKGKESYPYFFNKIELVQANEATVGQSLGYQNAHDRIRKLSNEELANLNIATINDAIDHSLVAKTSLLPEQDYLRENLKNYYFVPLYYPIYAGLQNDQGTVGGLQFRKTALELLAAKGWEDGFIPYATDKLKAEAEAAGRPLSDQFIFEKLFANHYTDYASFKKAMYKERWDKKDRLKAVTISFNGQTETIDNVETLSRLMADAVDKDYQAAKNKQVGFNRQGLKDAILKAYVGLTDSFTSSIFTE